MNAKVKIVLRPNEWTSFTSWYLEDLWQQYFDFEMYDPDVSYCKSTIFAVYCGNATDHWVDQLIDQGHRVLFDNLWERVPSHTRTQGVYTLGNRNWCWYNESLWWRALGYHNYCPNKTYGKLAFMPIRTHRPIRDYIVQQLAQYLDQMIWSYKDKVLPNDASDSCPDYQRYMNPQWYNDSYFSLVVETSQIEQHYWPTDKTFKPIAYYHPFLIAGEQYALKNLRALGFETYSNIFDESYDNEPNFRRRLEMMIKNLDLFEQVSYNNETLRRAEHNHNLFFDKDLVESRIINEVIHSILEYAET